MDTNELPAHIREILRDIRTVAGNLWNREWAERNAGNMSFNLSGTFDEKDLTSSKFTEHDFPESAANMTLFITGKGSRLRSLVDRPEEVSCILHINQRATGYYTIWGGNREDFYPTSELISHVKIQLSNMTHRADHKAVLHTHPLELLVLSHHPLFQDQQKLNHALWKMCPEIRVFVPRGVWCAQYELPSSEALANVTLEGLKSSDVVLWEKHGALATGTDMSEAFDFMDVANKGAKLLLYAWWAGFEPAGLTDSQMKELEQFI